MAFCCSAVYAPGRVWLICRGADCGSQKKPRKRKNVDNTDVPFQRENILFVAGRDRGEPRNGQCGHPVCPQFCAALPTRRLTITHSFVTIVTAFRSRSI